MLTRSSVDLPDYVLNVSNGPEIVVYGKAARATVALERRGIGLKRISGKRS